jgi:hypothetical protein
LGVFALEMQLQSHSCKEIFSMRACELSFFLHNGMKATIKPALQVAAAIGSMSG